MRTEFYIVANSFAAPFFSDTDTAFVKAWSPGGALRTFAKSYSHPAGLYCADCYRDANAEAKREAPLARWESSHLTALQRATKGQSGYSYYGRAPGDFDVNGKPVRVKNPKGGHVLPNLPAETPRP